MFTRILRNSFCRNFISIQSRNLNIHEYQSQDLMRKYNVAVGKGCVCTSVNDVDTILKDLDSEDFVVKAQILAGGRGKGTFTNGFKGGVHLATTPSKVKDIVDKMLGKRLVTKQTGADGQLVNKVLIASRYYIRREAYFAILLDRKTSTAVLVGSKYGGMNIEEVAEQNPDAIVKIPVKIDDGPTDKECLHLAKELNFPEKLHKSLAEQVRNLYKLFTSTDATQVEINPLVETSNSEILCLDAKINFDDNAAFRQKDIFSLRDFSQEDKREVEASKYDLNFIGLDGSIGCLVNGAGLAMATMDIIQLEGGSPANFLDVGGGATDKQVTEALKIIASDSKVKAILVNIFGGIMKCDVIATGIVNAVRYLNLQVPIVVRLSGTNVEKGNEIIKESGLKVIAANELGDAAKKVVTVANIVETAKAANIKVSFSP